MFRTSEGTTMFSPPGFQEMIKTNRLVFDMAYQWMCLIQDHMESLTENWLEPTFKAPQEISKQQFGLVNAIKSEREKLKKTIDMGFETLEGFLEPTQFEKSSQTASEKVKEATGQKRSSSKGGTKRATPRRGKNSSAKSASAE